MQVLYGREHQSRLVSGDWVLGGVQQAFSHEMFVHENVTSVRKRDVVPCEAGEVGAQRMRRLLEVTGRAAVGEDQAGTLLDELLMVCEWFWCVLWFGWSWRIYGVRALACAAA